MKVVSKYCNARVGLMGNPSDGFHGKTISFLIDNFRADVTITEQEKSSGIVLRDVLAFADFNHLCNHSKIVGYGSGMKLLQATCKVFFRLCTDKGLDCIYSKGFIMSYDTNIPRMVGLSGSSAIIVAAFNALLEFYELSLELVGIEKHEFPSIILSVETDELGIAAGLQDRVIQCYGGLVFMDFSNPSNRVYQSMDINLLPQMYLAYNLDAGGDSGKVHSTVKERWNSGDFEVIDGMKTLAAYAEEAKYCLFNRNYLRLAALMKLNFATRRKLYGDSVVGAKNLEVALLADELGFSAKFSGSGGAILCLRSDGLGWYDEETEKNIEIRFLEKGYKFIRLKMSNVS